MTFLARFMCLMAAVFIVSAPAMACCLTGDHQQTASSALVPSCHEAMPVAQGADEPESSSCPSCDDFIIMATASLDTSGVLIIDNADAKYAMLAGQTPLSLRPQRFVQTTRPPPDRRLRRDTLITLKQRLTI